MRTRVLSPLNIAVHTTVLLLVLVWTIPTIGLLVTSLRDKNQIVASGWWTALTSSSQKGIFRAPGGEAQRQEGAAYVISGNVLEGGSGTVSAFGTSSLKPEEFEAGSTAQLKDGQTLTVAADGTFKLSSNASFEGSRGQRVFFTSQQPPRFSLDNYRTVLNAEGIGKSFFNSLTVAVPATIIPILVAAFAAYALAWMPFPGRSLLLAGIVGLLVVPLQMSLIPLLRIYNDVGAFFGCRPRPILASGWRIWVLACHSPSISCAITSPDCRVKLWNQRGSMAPVISRSSSRSCCRCPIRRWRPSRSSSFYGPGTTCWSPWCFWGPVTRNWC